MIEINLSPSRQSGSITQVAGIDLSHINVKMMLIAIIIWLFPGGYIEDYYNEKIQINNKISQKLNKENRQLGVKVRSMSNIQKQVDALAAQEKKLAKKLEAVKAIIAKRSNPFKVLDYISTNLPTDVWLTGIELTGKNLVIRGFSKDWKNLGTFLENLKNSIFFSQNISYSRPQGVPGEYQGQRVEVFEIKAVLVRFK